MKRTSKLRKKKHHAWALFGGICIDLIVGDPPNCPHPIRWMGRWIGCLDKNIWARCPKTPRAQRIAGAGLVVCVLMPTAILSKAALAAAGAGSRILELKKAASILKGRWPKRKSHAAGLRKKILEVTFESVFVAYLLAAKSLKKESMLVYEALKHGTLDEARKAVSRIVGRDVQALDREGVIRAAVETVAENTTDGVIAPLFYIALTGPVGGALYKAVSTMDSMIGYENERYRYFGTAAAKLDDVLAFVPARLASMWMLGATAILEKIEPDRYSVSEARRIFKRDHRAHKSPNAACTESVTAGALGIRLAGDAVYFGKLKKKPFIGDDRRPVEVEDIRRANRLMMGTAALGAACCFAIRLGLDGVNTRS